MLKKPMKELKSSGLIKLEDFVKLFTFLGKTDSILEVLDKEVRIRSELDKKLNSCLVLDENKQQGLQKVCREVMAHVKRLLQIFRKEKNIIHLNKTEQVLLVEHKKSVLKKIEELYGLDALQYITGYAKKLVADPETLLKMFKDPGIKALISKEYANYQENDFSQSLFPHTPLLDQYVLFLRF